MQTDPNWGNFLYDEKRDRLNLIDFGAARAYPAAFVDDYLRMVRACALKQGDEVVERSTRLGFLTGVQILAAVSQICAACRSMVKMLPAHGSCCSAETRQ